MPGPLHGIKVFDMTVADVGSNASMTLALLGANVIKFEVPKATFGNDQPPPQNGVGVIWMVGHLLKRSAVLNFKDPRHRDAALSLAYEADLFVNNMRVGVADRLGFGYEALRERNPGLIYLYSSAWGTTGPMREERGHDALVQMFGGVASITGEEGGRPELLRYFGHLDRTTASYIVAAALTALYERRRTGKGRYIELSMLGSALAMQANRVGEYFGSGESPKPLGSAAAVTAPHQAFLCQDKKYLAVGVVNDAQWLNFCLAIDQPELAVNPRFATNPDRVERRRELAGLLQKIFLTKPLRWWELALTKHDVPNSRFLDSDALRTDPQALANGHVTELDTGRWGTIYAPDVPWEFSRTPVKIGPAPKPGEHTEDLLAHPSFERARELV